MPGSPQTAPVRPLSESGAASQTASPRPTISIVIPAYNEEGGIRATLEAVRAATPPGVEEIIVVDDGSSDRTAAIASEAGVRVVRHPNNRGYGASLKTGIREATGDFVLTMDADGQHRMEDVIALCQAISHPDAPECVIGHRVPLEHREQAHVHLGDAGEHGRAERRVLEVDVFSHGVFSFCPV